MPRKVGFNRRCFGCISAMIIRVDILTAYAKMRI